MTQSQSQLVRPIVVTTQVICLAVAAAPWLTGGREPIAMMISAFALLAGLLLAWRAGGLRGIGWGPITFGYVGIMVLAMLSLLWTPNAYSSWIWIASWGLAGAAFYLAHQVVAHEAGKQMLLKAYGASVVVFSVIALWMYFTGTYDRLTGSFFWPNPAAAYYFPAIFLLFGGYISAHKRRLSVQFGGALTLVFTLFLLTGSRAAIAVLAFAMLLFCVVSKATIKHCIHLLFILIIAFTLTLPLAWLAQNTGKRTSSPALGSRILEVASGTSLSGTDRIHYLTSALQMWFEHPIGGVGAGAYGDVHPAYQREVVSASKNVHNEYVQILAELGILGVMCLALILLAGGVGIVRDLVTDSRGLAAAFGLLALLLHIGLDVDARYPALLILAAIMMGALWRRWRQLPAPARFGNLAWICAIIGVAVVTASLYQSEVWAERGRSMQAEEEYKLAAEHFALAAQGVAYNPDVISAEAINRLTLVSTGDLPADQARSQLNVALGLARSAQDRDRYDAQHWQLTGRIFMRQREFVRARTAFETALKRDRLNHPAYSTDLARVTLQLDGDAPALRIAREALARYPPAVVAHRSADPAFTQELGGLAAFAGLQELKLGNLAQARQDSALATSLAPENFQARVLASQIKRLPSAPTPQ